MYYMVYFDGQFTIKQINPRNDLEHFVVYEIKTEFCLGFSVSPDNKYFYFIADHKIINKLERQKESTDLVEVGELKLKDKDRPHFSKNILFPELIINEKYLIQNATIFYLYNETPLENGILDSEDLRSLKDDNNDVEEKQYAIGPKKIAGSDEFINVYKYGSNMIYKLRIYQLPHSQEVTLISDFHRKVELTTFLDSGNVLMKVANRYFIFDSFGGFMDEIEFTDIIKEQEKMEKLENNKMSQALFANINHSFKESQGSSNMLHRKSTINRLSLENLDKKEEDAKPAETISFWNRMQLLKLSLNNNYFLFEDRLQKKFKVYKLKNLTEENVMEKLIIKKKGSKVHKEQNFEF